MNTSIPRCGCPRYPHRQPYPGLGTTKLAPSLPRMSRPRSVGRLSPQSQADGYALLRTLSSVRSPPCSTRWSRGWQRCTGRWYGIYWHRAATLECEAKVWSGYLSVSGRMGGGTREHLPYSLVLLYPELRLIRQFHRTEGPGETCLDVGTGVWYVIFDGKCSYKLPK